MKLKYLTLIAAALFWFSGTTTALAQSNPVSQAVCKKDWDLVKQLTRTCWECFFPLTIIGIPIGGTTAKLPDDRVKSPICLCPGRTGYPSPGFTLGWWSPDHTIEMVRQPWCMPTLGGFVLTDDADGFSSLGTPGRWGHASPSGSGGKNDSTYYNFHWYKFPIGYLVGWLSDYLCSKKSATAIDIAFMSEFDPSWNNDLLAVWTAPEAKLFSKPWAYVACSADAAISTVHKPMKSLYFCAGAWGMVMPMAGTDAQSISTPTSSSLLATRGIARMHRYGIAHRTYGMTAICANRPRFILEKQQYRFQMAFPMSEKKFGKMGTGSGTSNHWIGASSFKWGGEWSTQPMREDYIYLQWQYSDCCVTFW